MFYFQPSPIDNVNFHTQAFNMNKKSRKQLVKKTSSSTLKNAYKIGTYTETLNFDWSNPKEVMAKIEEEVDELKESLKEGRDNQIHELGDVLFSVVQFARHLDIDPDTALDQMNKRFKERIKTMIKISSYSKDEFPQVPMNQKEALWKKAKKIEKNKKGLV